MEIHLASRCAIPPRKNPPLRFCEPLVLRHSSLGRRPGSQLLLDTVPALHNEISIKVPLGGLVQGDSFSLPAGDLGHRVLNSGSRR